MKEHRVQFPPLPNGPNGPNSPKSTSIRMTGFIVFFGVSLFLWENSKAFPIAIAVTAGTTQNKLIQPWMQWQGAFYYQFDNQSWLGIAGGQEAWKDSTSYPLLAALNVRIPIGRIVLPVANAKAGWLFAENPGFTWRLGGGFDIKNGSRSSILLMGGYMERIGEKGWYWQAGILLEL